MDINLFLGHWKDGRRYIKEKEWEKEDNMSYGEIKKKKHFFQAIGKTAEDIRERVEIKKKTICHGEIKKMQVFLGYWKDGCR